MMSRAVTRWMSQVQILLRPFDLRRLPVSKYRHVKEVLQKALIECIEASRSGPSGRGTLHSPRSREVTDMRTAVVPVTGSSIRPYIHSTTETPLVAQVVFEWIEYLRTHRQPDGDLKKDGSLSSHFEKASQHLRPFVFACGGMDVSEFRARHLKELQTLMVTGQWRTDEHGFPIEDPKGWSEEVVNQAVSDVRRLYSWLELYERVPKGTVQHLSTVRNLIVDRDEREVVDDRSFETTLRYTSPVIAAVARLQRITAARPSELLIMRPCDIHICGDEWTYWATDHKLAYKKIDRPIPLGPACQAILAPFLKGRDPQAFMFTPAESDDWWNNNRLSVGGRKPRKTKRYPSEIRRVAANKIQRKSLRAKAPHFTRQTYCTAIKRAIRRARKAGEAVADWTPYIVRHTRITEVQEALGWESARAVGGHRHLSTTKIYAHQRQERDLRVAREVQEYQAK